jgi:vitamin B12 transporter
MELIVVIFYDPDRKALTGKHPKSAIKAGRIRLSPSVFALLFTIALSITVPISLLAGINTRLSGTVYDDELKSSVLNAEVVVIGTGYSAVTDFAGQFYFENLPPGDYDIIAFAPGYDTSVIKNISIIPDNNRRISIYISRKVYQLGKITVRDRRPKTPSNITLISKADIESSKARDLADVLESIDGLIVQKSGTLGQIKVRIRGSNPGHVLVLIDGQKINPSGDGIADLSTVPVDLIEKIEVHKGGASAEFGPDALGGVVNIITRPQDIIHDSHFEVRSGMGKWRTKEIDLSLTGSILSKNHSGKLAFGRRQTDGDFDFQYSIRGPNEYDTTHTGVRLNNSFISDNYYFAGLHKINNTISLNYSGQIYDSRRGLPGPATNQNQFARSIDNRKLFTSGLIYESVAAKYKLDFGYSVFKQDFLDTLTPQAALQFNSNFENIILSLHHALDYFFNFDNSLRIGMDFRREDFDHDDLLRPTFSMGNSRRYNYSAFLSDKQGFDISRIRIFDYLFVSTALRYDNTKTVKDSTSWQDPVKTNKMEFGSHKIGLNLTGGSNISYSLNANYGKSFRLPTINALFWKGDTRSRGNPGLKPERSEHSQAGVETDLPIWKISLSGGITYFHNRISDLVIWQPNFAGEWQPINLASSQITGHEDFIELTFLDGDLSLKYQNTITTALNKVPGHNSFNKRLVFYPHYVTMINIKMKSGIMYGSYNIRMIDRIFTNNANTRYYDGYRLDDFKFGFETDLGKIWTISADMEICNIGDVDYVLMSQYPMPGRDINAALSIKYKLK